MSEKDFDLRIDLTEFSEKIKQVKNEIKKLIIGQDQMIDQILISLIADGHILIEGVPGVAKTLTARLVSQIINTEFKRIQFTPDLMPADIIGTSVYNAQKGSFEFKKGPIFSNIVLIDEINRAPAKTQSALFEVMEERSITVEGKTHQLTEPFIIIGTQNPIEYEGTYRLPEAQLDRFFFKIDINLPSLEEEIEILNKYNYQDYKDLLKDVKPCLSTEELLGIRKQINNIHVEKDLIEYIAKIVNETRNNPDIFLGASPRASLAILKAAKVFSALNGKDFITPEDIQYVAIPALIHRIIPSSEKEIEGIQSIDIIRSIIKKIEIPR
ncbi:MAG: AAA domain-containing protein [Bacteroidales bacterium]|nr:AAA domain-containing protein [Bacteroidales bacterium]